MSYTSFNAQDLMQQFKGDEEILLEMIILFQRDYAVMMNSIKKSIVSEDAEHLRLHAHTFKGVLSNFYAKESKNLAFELEVRGAQSMFIGAFDVFNRLENLLQVFLAELVILQKRLAKNS